eukprot:347241-Chlamydomonas_euryale.AAC.1
MGQLSSASGCLRLSARPSGCRQRRLGVWLRVSLAGSRRPCWWGFVWHSIQQMQPNPVLASNSSQADYQESALVEVVVAVVAAVVAVACTLVLKVVSDLCWCMRPDAGMRRRCLPPQWVRQCLQADYGVKPTVIGCVLQ